MIISFAWTTNAFLAGRKRKTRRNWAPQYARRFKAGTSHQAYDKNPRIGGHQIGTVGIERDPYLQRTSMMTEDDFEAEGFKWMEENGISMRGVSPRQFFEDWKAADELVFVVEFETLECLK
ncbi:MAG: hypothetical protein P3T54_00100 [Dehalogenimonas sp.]|nr:hypothetical protein [Dehalogenimonas sp.]